jgi:hypothetical protein
MAYTSSRLAITNGRERSGIRLIQQAGNFAGKLGSWWYGPTTFCKHQGLAEDLARVLALALSAYLLRDAVPL